METAFHNLPTSSFPFTVTLFEAGTDVVLFTQRVVGPGVLAVPSFGRPVDTLLEYGDGAKYLGKAGEAVRRV